jgi:hypothetical protein
MPQAAQLRAKAIIAGFLVCCSVHATTIARLSLDEMTARSETIVSGQITDSWTAWDSDHKYIWTHYTVTVDSTVKGTSARTVEITEPGGVVGIVGMNIGGATSYTKGEHVMIFLERMPNGYLRTAGLGQGKYGIDAQGRLHGIALKDADVIEGRAAGAPAQSISAQSLNGMTVADAMAHITSRMQVAPKGVR